MEIALSPENMTKLDNAVTECVNSLFRAQSEKEFRKEVVSVLKEEIDIETADFNALVKERFDESVSKRIEKLEGVVELNEALKTHRRNNKVVTTSPDDLDDGEDIGDVDV